MSQAEKVSDVLTVEEARGRLRISRNAAYQAIERKEIPSITIGRRILIPREKFEQLLKGDVQRTGPQAA